MFVPPHRYYSRIHDLKCSSSNSDEPLSQEVRGVHQLRPLLYLLPRGQAPSEAPVLPDHHRRQRAGLARAASQVQEDSCPWHFPRRAGHQGSGLAVGRSGLFLDTHLCLIVYL